MGQRHSSTNRALAGAELRKENMSWIAPSSSRFSTASKGMSRSTGSTSGRSARSFSRAGRRSRSSAVFRQPMTMRWGASRLASFIRDREMLASFTISPAYWRKR